MTIKGTLETFNLPDLLQMLAFNQKVGTLVLETGAGPRTLYVENGSLGFVQGDPMPSKALARILRRDPETTSDRLARGVSISANSGRYLGDALEDLGVLDATHRTEATQLAISELFFDLIQTPLQRFEFVEGRRLAPSGLEGDAIEPLCAVDSLLLELTRKIDEWGVLRTEVPTEDEVYEPTDVPADLPEVLATEGLGQDVADRVMPLLDGARTVAAIVEESDEDRFLVVKLIAALHRQGVLRTVPTSELVERGEERLSGGKAGDAVPLLRRAVLRGDAPSTVRMRLGEALASNGDPVAAAAEFDAYSSASEATDPVGTFEALWRAMGLRGQDAATAARVCDHYLHHANRLRTRSSDALTALRRLISGASAAGRPAEAASRLARFLERGEAPAEDQLVLADLWNAAGLRPEAAQALIRRAEGLLHLGHLAPARELMRRAMGYDPTRIDVKRRLADLDQAESRRKHRRRVVVLGTLLVLTLASAGGVYLVHDGKSARAAEQILAKAEMAVREAETTSQGAIADLAKAVDRVADGTAPAASLPPASAAMRSAVDRAATAARSALVAAETEIGEVAGPRLASSRDRLRDLDARRASVAKSADSTVTSIADRAKTALDQGEKAFKDGNFISARSLLSQAVRLSVEDESRSGRAQKSLDQVESYISGFERGHAQFEAAVAKGNSDEAWRLGCRLLATFLDSDLTRKVLLPVPVKTVPAGATLKVGSAAPLASPNVVRYSPFDGQTLSVRSPGCVPQFVPLPTFQRIHDAEATGGLEPMKVELALAAGPRWTFKSTSVAGPFSMGDTAWVVTDDGLTLRSLRSSDGAAVDVHAVPALSDRIRAVGRGPVGLWLLIGLRSYMNLADGGTPWQFQTAGRLDRAPATAAGTVLLADDTGGLSGVDASTGAPRWHSNLDSSPVGVPSATAALGFVLTSTSGETDLVDPTTGKLSVLVPGEAKRAALATAWPPASREGVLVVAGGSKGLLRITPDRESHALGDADPDASIGLFVSPLGCAWVEHSGAVRFLPKDAKESAPSGTPVDVTGVGPTSWLPAVADGTVYAVGRDGVLRAARLGAPTVAAWKVTLSSKPLGGPVVAGEIVLVRTETGIVAFER